MYNWARPGAASWNRPFYGTLSFLFTITVCCAVLVNRTIDSNFGDPVTGFIPIYQPPQAFWVSQPCSDCYIRPNPAKAFDGTWNSATYIPGNEDVNVTLRFTGVAVWVFFILPNSAVYGTGLTASTLVNITLDGEYVKSFSHQPDPKKTDAIFNATIFSASDLVNTAHELVVGTNGYYNYSYINFDGPSTHDGAPTGNSQSISTTTAFPSTTALSSTASTSSSTPASQSSSSKSGVIVGSTLGGLAVIALVFIFLVRRLRRAPPVRYKKDEGMLDIDVPTHDQPNHNRKIPVSVHAPTQSKAVRERQRGIDERNQSAQREQDNLRAARNARSTDEIGNPSAANPSQPSPELASLRNAMQQLRDQVEYAASPSQPSPELASLRNAMQQLRDQVGYAAGPSQPSPELASLRNDMQQLRDQVEYLHAQRESDLALLLPPAYPNDVQ